MATESPEPATDVAGPGVSRRVFLQGVGATALAGTLTGRPAAADDAPAATPADAGAVLRGNTPVTLSINGQARDVVVEPRTTLLSALRDRLSPALTGPKLVCDAGTCGACTVIIDGRTAYACSVFAVDLVGRQITTVEGLGTPENLSPVQQAFCEKDAMMCGFCTSGFVTSVTALLQHNPDPSPEQVREGCKGNFCRCGTFPHVFEAALAAADSMKKGKA